MQKKTISIWEYLRYGMLGIIFLVLAMLFYMWFSKDTQLASLLQGKVFAVGFAVLLASLITAFLLFLMRDTERPHAPRKAWFYPLLAGGLSLAGLCLAYIYLGIYPIGEKTGMIVDMHHQYAPLLAQLRDMLIHGGNPLYSFDIGMGTSFLPMFGYYLASPLNFLLVFFPEHLLAEGIFFITLVKNVLSAVFFALCVQYVYRRRDLHIVIVSVMYAMMMYVIAYSWNIMWLDGFMLLPLVVLGFERMMRTGRYMVYILSLAYVLYTNYYIGFMICLFMVLYYFGYALRKPRALEQQGRGFLRFAVGSLLGGGLAMCLLVPVAMALGQTSAAGGTLPDWAANFNMFKLLGRHLTNTSPTIRSGNLPNLYCGILAVVLVPIFATLKSIPLRRRVTYMGLLFAMGMSFVLNRFDLIWHGLHAPNDLPYRFSFLYCFMLLLIAYETLHHIKSISFKQIGFTLCGIVTYLMIEEKWGDKIEDKTVYGFSAIYVSLLLVVVYAAVLALASRRKLQQQCAYMLLLAVVVAEMTLSASVGFKTLNSQEFFTSHNDYVDNEATKAVQAAVDKTEAYGNAHANGAFYRMEFLPRRTCVDTALFDYHGITVFASSNSYKATRFMGSLGYAINGVNSHLYRSFVAPVDSLLGIRYVTLGTNLSAHPQLEKVDSVKTGDTSYYIYENASALPIGYFVQDQVKNWTADFYSPFDSQNSLFSAMTGDTDGSMYSFMPVRVDTGSGDNAQVSGDSHVSLNPPTGGGSSTFRVPVSKKGQVFLYVDCRAAKDISASCGSNSWTISPSEPYIIDAGVLNDTDEITVTINTNAAATGNVYAVTLNEPVFQKTMSTLAAGGLAVTDFSDTHIKGTLTAPQKGVMFTSIPYDKGWTVKVDGKKVETYGIGDTSTLEYPNGAMLALNLEEGTHTVELSFFPQGLALGGALTLCSIAGIVALLWITRRKRVQESAPLLPADDAPTPPPETPAE